ncbi:MAG: glycoside hydrolase family 10 protein, partial [Acutalibacteraceae bacterium]
MKRLVLLILAVMLCLCSCSNDMLSDDSKDTIDLDNAAVKEQDDDAFLFSRKDTFVGTWLSYLELTYPEKDFSKEQYTEYIDGLLENAEKIGVSDIFVHAVSFSDSIYPSEIYPSSERLAGKRGDKLPFDFLNLIIERAKKHNLRVHAWINPYRIQSEFDESKLCKTETAYRLLKSGSGDVVKADAGLYYNPASERVIRLVTDAVKELMSGYDLAGIHIDDYFYPSCENGFDKNQYDEYKKCGGNESLDSWRKENVNKLVRSIYSAVKSFGEDKLFTISPGGDIEKDICTHYADVKLWLKEDGYCDMVIPQIYFGFENESQPFEECFEEWKNAACGDT